VVMKIMNWKTRSIFERYGFVDEKLEKDEMKRILEKEEQGEI
jgi:hypothetical protein